MQSSARIGRCPHNGHASGIVLWPYVNCANEGTVQVAQIDFSQQGNRYGSRANLLHIEHFKRAGTGPAMSLKESDFFLNG